MSFPSRAQFLDLADDATGAIDPTVVHNLATGPLPVFFDTWDAITDYVLNNVVQHSDWFWITLVPNTNSEPIDGNTDWHQCASASVGGGGGGESDSGPAWMEL